MDPGVGSSRGSSVPGETRSLGAPRASSEWSAVSLLEPPQQSDEIGRLAGFRVLGILGQGGMGVVFRAEDSQLVRPVALKVLRPELVSDPSAGRRFLREARAMAAIRNEHVVTIYQVGESNHVWFLAMELLEGCTLEQFLERAPDLSLRQVLRIGRETAEGLAAVHAAGMLHRDVKPGNLWLEAPSGRVKVLDFGTARIDDAEEPGPGFGTPAYMSPEQILRRPVDARCDVYSLGVVLFRLLTGRLPFADSLAQVLLERAAREPAPGVRQLAPLTPEPVAEYVARLLAKSPSDRPATTRDVASRLAELERLAGGGRQSIDLDPAPGPNPTRRQWLTAASAAAVLTIGGWTMLRSPRAHRPQPEPLARLWKFIEIAPAEFVWVDFQSDAGAPALYLGSGDQLSSWSYESDRPVRALAKFGCYRMAYNSSRGCIAGASAGGETIDISYAGDAAPRSCPAGAQPIHSIAWHPVADRIAIGRADGSLSVSETSPWRTVWSRPGAHRVRVDSVAFADNGGLLISAGQHDPTVRGWDAATGRPLWELDAFPGADGAAEGFCGLAATPDGRLVAASAHDLMTVLIDVTKRRVIKALPGLSGSLAIDRTGRYLAGCRSAPDGRHSVQIWDLTNVLPVAVTPGRNAVVRSIAWHPKQASFVAASVDGHIGIWEAYGLPPAANG
jgi:serine/threonine protein kinase